MRPVGRAQLRLLALANTGNCLLPWRLKVESVIERNFDVL
jgi:hypothetical protein